ncbi:MAG: radical SAM protein [Bacillota bacterium]
MPPISIMIKPASSLCNLKCKYCFYHFISDSRESYSYGMMKQELVRKILYKAFEFTKGQAVNISFQGGEPLLRGKEFFIKFNEYVKELNKNNSPVNIAIQTNGTLIDDEWCKIFYENNYLVGLSLDGDKLANVYRLDKENNQVFDLIMKNVKLLKSHKVDFNILSVLTDKVANRINKIYEFFLSQGIKHIQFIPCLKPLNEDIEDKMYLTGEQYGEFLINLFRLYYKDFIKGNYVSIRQLDNFVQLASARNAEQCGMNGHCSYQFVIEANGNVYPCDFYCLDEYITGNINNQDFKELSKNTKAVNFIKESISLEPKCKLCKYYKLCRGGCKRERKDIEFCKAYKIFFKECISDLLKLRNVYLMGYMNKY